MSDAMYGLPDKAIQALIQVFCAYLGIKKVILYGSRAMGNSRPESDIDLCLEAPHSTSSPCFK